MIEELIAAKKTDLLCIGYALAAKVFDDEDLPWLKRRFAMLSDYFMGLACVSMMFLPSHSQDSIR